jgi:hypothetical protein
MKQAALEKEKSGKPGPVSSSPYKGSSGQIRHLTSFESSPSSSINDDYTSLKEAASKVKQLRLSAQRELEQARKMRAEAQRYQQETETKARSEAHQLVLRTRLTTQREIEELIRQASEEIQKMLADIRVIRITAQEELAAQRKFTDAAKLKSMSFSFKEEKEESEKPLRKRKKQLVISD